MFLSKILKTLLIHSLHFATTGRFKKTNYCCIVLRKYAKEGKKHKDKSAPLHKMKPLLDNRLLQHCVLDGFIRFLYEGLTYCDYIAHKQL